MAAIHIRFVWFVGGAVLAACDCGWVHNCGARGCPDCKDDGSPGFRECCPAPSPSGNCGWVHNCGPRGCPDCKDDGSQGFRECCPVHPGPSPAPSPGGSASTTRYWDCGGGGCGEGVNCPNAGGCQQFWPGAACASHHAAMRRINYMGVSVYGTAAASDNFFACGDCVLLTAPAGGKMIVRVNNQCPGSSNPACREAHFDIAVPGFDNLQWSVNNQCNHAPHNCDPAINSDLCAYGSIASCDCSRVSSDPVVSEGCRLFQGLAWGDNPRVTYQKVACPSAQHFVQSNHSRFVV